MPQVLTDDKSTLVQVMAWCRQATSHYLNQCWPWSPTSYGITRPQWVKCDLNATAINTLRWRQNCGYFADIFKTSFLNENIWILLKIPMKFVLKIWINNIPTLVQIMAWPRPGNKPLSETVMVSLLMHIYITWPQWVKKSMFQNGREGVGGGWQPIVFFVIGRFIFSQCKHYDWWLFLVLYISVPDI